MSELNEAKETTHAAYYNEIETLAEEIVEQLEASPLSGRNTLYRKFANNTRAVTHHPHLTLATSNNAPTVEDADPRENAEELAHRAVMADVREEVEERL